MTGLHFRSFGPNEGKPLLLLHGFWGSLDDWQPMIAALGGECRCIAVDLPGHGSSRNLGGCTFEDTADALVALLEHFKLERTSLLGYSMGGRLALYTALRHRSRFDLLMLVSASAGIIDEKERRARRRWEEAWAAKLKTQELEQTLLEWYDQPLFDSLRRSPRFAEVLKRRAANEPQSLAEVLLRLGASAQPPLYDRLRALPMPLHLIIGELDRKYAEISQHILASNPNAVLHTVPDCGHAVHLDKPLQLSEIVRAIMNFHTFGAALSGSR